MSDTTLPASRLRESLGYLNWLYNPFHGLDAAGIYDLLATSSPTERGLYLNLGYWQAATDLDAASDALAMLVGERRRSTRGPRAGLRLLFRDQTSSGATLSRRIIVSHHRLQSSARARQHARAR
jgi:hypothetical protein